VCVEGSEGEEGLTDDKTEKPAINNRSRTYGHGWFAKLKETPENKSAIDFRKDKQVSSSV
jgi:hypothetical protein